MSPPSKSIAGRPVALATAEQPRLLLAAVSVCVGPYPRYRVRDVKASTCMWAARDCGSDPLLLAVHWLWLAVVQRALALEMAAKKFGIERCVEEHERLNPRLGVVIR